MPCLTLIVANLKAIGASRGSSGHFALVACTLWTWAAHLLDAESVRFMLVTYSTAEQLSLRRVLNSAGLQHTRLQLQTHALPQLVRHVDGKGAFAPRRTVYAQRHAKVLYGALTSGARHCLIWDAEGWIARDVNLSQLAASYADEPFILHEPLDALAASSHEYAGLQRATARWLGEGRRGAANLSRWYGYSLGYWWLVDVRVLWQLHAHVTQARHAASPSLDNSVAPCVAPSKPYRAVCSARRPTHCTTSLSMMARPFTSSKFTFNFGCRGGAAWWPRFAHTVCSPSLAFGNIYVTRRLSTCNSGCSHPTSNRCAARMMVSLRSARTEPGYPRTIRSQPWTRTSRPRATRTRAEP